MKSPNSFDIKQKSSKHRERLSHKHLNKQMPKLSISLQTPNLKHPSRTEQISSKCRSYCQVFTLARIMKYLFQDTLIPVHFSSLILWQINLLKPFRIMSLLKSFLPTMRKVETSWGQLKTKWKTDDYIYIYIYILITR